MSENQETEYVEREAKLSEVGVYADKGVELTENDFETMIANHEPAPILVEHSANPLKLGILETLYAKGKELFGKLRITRAANELIFING